MTCGAGTLRWPCVSWQAVPRKAQDWVVGALADQSQRGVRAFADAALDRAHLRGRRLVTGTGRDRGHGHAERAREQEAVERAAGRHAEGQPDARRPDLGDGEGDRVAQNGGSQDGLHGRLTGAGTGTHVGVRRPVASIDDHNPGV